VATPHSAAGQRSDPVASDLLTGVLQQHRHTVDRTVEQWRNHAVQIGVEPFNGGDGCGSKLAAADLASRQQLALADSTHPSEIVHPRILSHTSRITDLVDETSGVDAKMSLVDEPGLFLVTGIMAAGKSTVGQALAERFSRGVHVRGDHFRRAVVAGREEMTSKPSDEAFVQLRLRYELAASVADRYVAAGFTTVLQDIVIGPLLDEVLAMIKTRPLALVVLAPTADEVARRELGRAKTGYTSITPADLDAVLRTQTSRRGLWLDSTSMTATETVNEILRRFDEALIH
jgi:predicted kinase